MTGKMLFPMVLVLAWFGTLYAGGAPIKRSSQPVQLKSNELLADSNSKTATFVGKVVARQGDITIYCDRLVVYYADQAKEMEKIEAFGNVRIVQGTRTATAAHALYENSTGKIILDGEPKVRQGENTVEGKLITIYLDEQRSVVSGGQDGRVNAEIYPGGKR